MQVVFSVVSPLPIQQYIIILDKASSPGSPRCAQKLSNDLDHQTRYCAPIIYSFVVAETTFLTASRCAVGLSMSRVPWKIIHTSTSLLDIIASRIDETAKHGSTEVPAGVRTRSRRNSPRSSAATTGWAARAAAAAARDTQTKSRKC